MSPEDKKEIVIFARKAAVFVYGAIAGAGLTGLRWAKVEVDRQGVIDGCPTVLREEILAHHNDLNRLQRLEKEKGLKP